MSIKKVAESAGVSIATISRYFSKPNLLKKETFEKVKKAVDAVNYKPNTLAQNFRRGKSGLIVVVVYNIGNPIYENFTHIITHIAQSKGYDVLIKESSKTHLTLKYYQDMLSSKQADGLIVMTDLPHTHHKTREALKNLPIVFIDGSNSTKDDSPLQYIGLDNYEAALDATNHLLALGHKHIICISPEELNNAYVQRIKGYTTAIDNMQLTTCNVLYTCQKPNNLENLLEHIISGSPPVTAIFCTDDDTAIDILPLLKNHGQKVPENISVVGFNNIRYAAKTSPPLTTVELPLANVAFQAIQLLCTKIDPSCQPNDDENDINTSPQHQLILRASTSTPPA
jgi:LacI family repressor for deo operon, udp, cdd, tsx, nupC, and nupG